MGLQAMSIGICLIATNSYFALGIRFIKKFIHYKKDSENVCFYFFSDKDPSLYLSEIEKKSTIYIPQFHESWLEGTNSKYNNILSLNQENIDYIFYFDADTDVDKNFSCDWFLGDMVAGEHFGNRNYMKDEKPFDRNPKSRAFVPEDTNLPSMYYYGAFYGGRKNNMIEFVKLMTQWQSEDKKIPYEPRWNDESYLNCYFHFNPPSKVIRNEDFCFIVSAKAGIENIRNPNLELKSLYEKMQKNKDFVYEIDIANNDVKPVSSGTI